MPPFFDARESDRSVIDNSPSAVVALDPVTLTHVFDADFGAGARRVHKTVVAEIDANVREGAPHRVEENQIAGFQFVLVNDVANFALFFRRSGQQLADRVPEYHLNEAAAVEPTVWVGAATTIINANQFQALEDQILSAIGVALEKGRLIAHRRELLSRPGNTGAA